MRVTIHQPVYLPYLGFFAKINASDTFIVYDTAQYEKGSTHNRQKIRTHAGWQWLTIPLSSSLTSFCDTKISYSSKQPWYQTHWRTLEQHYKKTRHFSKYADDLYRLYHEGHPTTLGDFNMRLIAYCMNLVDLQQEIRFFSDFGIDPALSPSEKLASAVEKAGGNEYLSGPSGKRYLDMAPFERRGITVTFFEFRHPQYPQYHSEYDGKFLPYMAGLDALCNVGSLLTAPSPRSRSSTIRTPLRSASLRDRGVA